MDNLSNNGESGMGNILYRFEDWLQAQREMDIIYRGFKAGKTKLLERNFDFQRLRFKDPPMDCSYVDPEGGCGYTVCSLFSAVV